MTAQQSSGTQKAAPQSDNRRPAARLCAVSCVAVSLALSVALVYAYAGVGCYLGLILMAVSACVLGGTALVLLAISAWLRVAELVWLTPVLLLIAFATGLTFQFLPEVVCGYPG